MRKAILMTCLLAYGLTINAQEIEKSKPITTFYKSGDQVIQTSSSGESVLFLFQDARFVQIAAIESVLFKDKEAMLYFFDKVSEVQLSDKTEKTVDLTVSMNDHVLNEKDVSIVRRGSKQFVTYIYVGEAFTIIPKTYLKTLMKKIKE